MAVQTDLKALEGLPQHGPGLPMTTRASAAGWAAGL